MSEHGSRPPARLPDGKQNPAYLRWYRRANPDKYAATRSRWQANRLNKVHATLGRPSSTQITCLECGTVYDREAATIRGFRFFGRHKCICTNCL